MKSTNPTAKKLKMKKLIQIMMEPATPGWISKKTLQLHLNCDVIEAMALVKVGF